MRLITSICVSLIVLALSAVAGQLSPREAAAQGWPWWAFESVLEEVQDRGTLRVGLGLFEPWSACNAEGELIGFEIDVATQVAADMGVAVEFVRTHWPYIIPALLAEEFDVIISGMAVLPSRNLKVNFTQPYHYWGVFVVAHTENAAALITPDDFNSPDVTIAALRSSSAIPAVARHFPAATVRLYESEAAVLRAVVAGEVHAATAFAVTAQEWVIANPDTLHIAFDYELARFGQAMAIRKGDLDTLNFLTNWIEARTADGWLIDRQAYWFEQREWVEQVATEPAVLAACEESFR